MSEAGRPTRTQLSLPASLLLRRRRTHRPSANGARELAQRYFWAMLRMNAMTFVTSAALSPFTAIILPLPSLITFVKSASLKA